MAHQIQLADPAHGRGIERSSAAVAAAAAAAAAAATAAAAAAADESHNHLNPTPNPMLLRPCLLPPIPKKLLTEIIVAGPHDERNGVARRGATGKPWE